MKQKKVKALFINAETEKITEVELDNKTMLHELYNTIGCSDVECVRNSLLIGGKPKLDDVWIDGEGLLKQNHHYWCLPYYVQPIAGNAIIMSCDKKGECIDHTFTPQDITALEKQIKYFHV